MWWLIGGAAVLIVLVAWSACVAAGRYDDATDRYMREFDHSENDNRD